MPFNILTSNALHEATVRKKSAHAALLLVSLIHSTGHDSGMGSHSAQRETGSSWRIMMLSCTDQDNIVCFRLHASQRTRRTRGTLDCQGCSLPVLETAPSYTMSTTRATSSINPSCLRDDCCLRGSDVLRQAWIAAVV